MAKLTDDEQAQLDALSAKRDAPDEPAASRGENVNYTIDLSDEKAVERALKLGLLRESDVEDNGGDEDASKDDDDGESRERPPKRKGYFE